VLAPSNFHSRLLLDARAAAHSLKGIPMKTVPFIFVLLMLVVLAACSGINQQPTPTPIDISALQTASVQTVVANLTGTAAAQPSATLEPSATIAAPSPSETVTVTPAVSATQSLCDDASFISDASVIDGTQMTAGQAFVKTWKVKNTGTCTWTTGYQIIFAYNEKMGGLPTALTSEVQPGAEAEISVNLVAPTKPGNYSGYWRLASNNGIPFGQFLSVVIVVP
jgi:hypothetical protein